MSAEMAPSGDAPMAAEQQNGFSEVNTDRALNTSGEVRAWTEDLLDAASGFRSEIYRLEGYVVRERIDYADSLWARTQKTRTGRGRDDSMASFTISVPIENLPAVLDWVRIHSMVIEEVVNSVRDSALPTPAAAAAQHAERRGMLEQRLEELEQLFPNATEEDRQRLESERQAVLLSLRTIATTIATSGAPLVKYATLNAHFETRKAQVRFAAARVVPQLRASLLVMDLLKKPGQRETRTGAAIGVALSSRSPGGMVPSPLLEVAGYPATATDKAIVVATVGVGQYARSMGDGSQEWLNPFVGARIGYAYAAGSALVVAGELGLEIYKAGGVALSASVRPQGLISDDSRLAVEAGSSLSLAF